MTPFVVSTPSGAAVRLRREIVATFALCWPIVLTNLAMNLMTTTDVMMLGWLSPESLAAGSLGFNLYLPLMLFCIGVVGAAAPIAASRIGADSADTEGVRRVGHQALISSLLLALPVWAILWNAAPILRAIGEPPQLATNAGLYVHGLQWAVAPLLLTFSTRSIFAALNRTGPVLVASLIAVVFNALANYALIFGHFGAPALGIFGSGLATSLSHLLMFSLLVGYSFLDPRTRSVGLFSRLSRFHAASFAQLWRLGLASTIGGTIAAEISVFSFSALAMGLIGPDSIEAHAIVIQIASTTFMVPLGLGQAASVRVGRAFGARDRAAISLAGWTAFWLAIGFLAAVAAAVMFAKFPRLLISPFIATEAPAHAAIVALALSFLRIAAIFQVFDGGQAALANMLRGVHDSRRPMVMALTGYWAIGMADRPRARLS